MKSLNVLFIVSGRLLVCRVVNCTKWLFYGGGLAGCLLVEQPFQHKKAHMWTNCSVLNKLTILSLTCRL